MIKAVIFDFDGVCCQNESYLLKKRFEYIKELGLEVSIEKLALLSGRTQDDREKIYDEIFQNQEKYKEVKDKILTYKNNEISFYDLKTKGIDQLLEELKRRNILIGIASNSSENRLYNVLRQCKIEHYFDLMTTPNIDNRKPNPYVYLESIRKLNISASECLVVEDSKVGIMAAKNAGIFVLALKDKDGVIDQSDADVIITDILQVIDYL